MSKVEELKKHLRRGKVYRRADLAKWSKSVDRHLDVLVKEGTLQKLSQGLYHYPRETAFGPAPPEDEVLVRSFLMDDRFLLTSFNIYNRLGIGTTQLYNQQLVYNHKRHGDFELGNKTFSFRAKSHIPKKLTPEYLLVDLVNNVEELAEDPQEVLEKAASKAPDLNSKILAKNVRDYGNSKAKRFFDALSLESV